MTPARLIVALALGIAGGCGSPDTRGEPSQPTAPAADEVTALFTARDRAHTDALAAIHHSPRIDGHSFDPAALLRAADALRPLGKDTALAVLRAYGELARTHRGRDDLDEQRIFLIVRVLCDPVDLAVLQPALAIGAPDVQLPAGFTAWPRFPLVEQDGVPFLVVSGYALAGKAESPDVHLDDCRDHGQLRPRPAGHAEFAAAAEALIASAAWREAMHGGDAAAMVRAQAARAARP